MRNPLSTKIMARRLPIALIALLIPLASYGGSPSTSGEASSNDLLDGFTVSLVAEGLDVPTSLAVGPAGGIFVSELAGPVLRLEDPNQDGVFENHVEYAVGRYFVNGIAFSPEGQLYVSSQGRVSIFTDADGDTLADTIDDIITDLPHGGHQNNGLAFGPDGKLFITNGSTCNDCDEDDERSASILQANADGSDLRVYASGLRNPYDLVFDPDGRLWATDNGSDLPCNTIDELNLVADGGDYGWPYGPDCESSQSGTPPVASLGFNTGSTGIDYYSGNQFPASYRGNLFMTLWGNNAVAPQPGGHVLVHAAITETAEGPTATVKEFATGFQNPIDVAVDTDGTLLVLDCGAGELYRIAYSG